MPIIIKLGPERYIGLDKWSGYIVIKESDAYDLYDCISNKFGHDAAKNAIEHANNIYENENEAIKNYEV